MAKSNSTKGSGQSRPQTAPNAGITVKQVVPVQGNPYNPQTKGKSGKVSMTVDLNQDYVAASRIWYPFLRAFPNAFDDLTREFGLDVYDRMLKDGEIASSCGVLTLACVSNGWKVVASPEAAENSPEEAKKFARFCQEALEDLRTPMLSVLEQLLDGLVMGSSVCENTWEMIESGEWAGKIRLRDCKSKPLALTAFVVDAFNNVVGIASRTHTGELVSAGNAFPVSFDKDNKIPGLLPRINFTVFTWNMKNQDPRGQSILRPAYSGWWFKQQVINEYLSWIARFAQPSIVGYTPAGALPIPLKDASGNIIYDQQGQATVKSPQVAMREGLEDLKSGSVFTAPNGADVKLLQILSDGTAFNKALDFSNREITRAILHQHLATGEGEHQSRASSQVHQDVLGMLIMYIKQVLCTVIKRDILKPMIALNWGEEKVKFTPNLDLGMGDGFPLTALDISRLQSVLYFTEDQMPAVDQMLGLPVRSRVEAMRKRIQDERSAQPMTGMAGGGAKEGGADQDSALYKKWLMEQQEDEDGESESEGGKSKEAPKKKPKEEDDKTQKATQAFFDFDA
jgi:Protein of unknown function (DUF935)